MADKNFHPVGGETREQGFDPKHGNRHRGVLTIAEVARLRRWRITHLGRTVIGTPMALRGHYFPNLCLRPRHALICVVDDRQLADKHSTF